MTGFAGISQTDMCVCVHVHALCNARRRSEVFRHAENPTCAGQRFHIDVVGAVCSCSDILY